jgi:hypothetical protein
VTLLARFAVDGFEPRQVTGLDADWVGVLTFAKTLESDPDTWYGHIVPGTGTGDFAGWSGQARIRHDDQGAYFEITLAS